MGKYGYVYGYSRGYVMKEPSVAITKEILNLITGIDEFKGEWKALGNLAPGAPQCIKKSCDNRIHWVINQN